MIYSSLSKSVSKMSQNRKLLEKTHKFKILIISILNLFIILLFSII